MRKTREEIAREREESMRRVFMPKNEYGFMVNIRNPVLQSWYESYKFRKKIHGAPSEEERLRWEQTVKSYIKDKYEEMYKEPYYCCNPERLEELVQRLGARPDEKL